MYGDVTNLNVYTERRMACHWSQVNLSDYQIGYAFDTSKQWWSEMNDSLFTIPQMNVHRCTQNLQKLDAQFIIDKLGPFNSSGGYDWHVVKYADTFGLASVNNSSSLFIIEGSILPVDLQGAILPSPPIHAHHWHINSGGNGDVCFIDGFCAEENGLWVLQTHGDSMCRVDHGGVGCYFQQSQPGFGIPLKYGKLGFFGETNDIRAMNSKPMAHWIEMSVTLTEHAVKEQYNLDWRFGFGNMPWVADDIYGKRMTLKVPTKGESLHWKTVAVVGCYVLGAVNFHTHHEMTRDMWILRGNGVSLGLDTFRNPSAGEALMLGSMNVTHNDVKDVIISNGGVLICAIAPLRERFEFVPKDNVWLGTEEGYYERHVRGSCRDGIVLNNEDLTLVGFFAANFLKSKMEFFAQHTNWGGRGQRCADSYEP